MSPNAPTLCESRREVFFRCDDAAVHWTMKIACLRCSQSSTWTSPQRWSNESPPQSIHRKLMTTGIWYRCFSKRGDTLATQGVKGTLMPLSFPAPSVNTLNAKSEIHRHIVFMSIWFLDLELRLNYQTRLQLGTILTTPKPPTYRKPPAISPRFPPPQTHRFHSNNTFDLRQFEMTANPVQYLQDTLQRWMESETFSPGLGYFASTKTTCPICRFATVNGDGARKLTNTYAVQLEKCGHVFHEVCLMEWFRHKAQDLEAEITCPMCRAVVVSDRMMAGRMDALDKWYTKHVSSRVIEGLPFDAVSIAQALTAINLLRLWRDNILDKRTERPVDSLTPEELDAWAENLFEQVRAEGHPDFSLEELDAWTEYVLTARLAALSGQGRGGNDFLPQDESEDDALAEPESEGAEMTDVEFISDNDSTEQGEPDGDYAYVTDTDDE
ncbi:hypothetical protein P154DRAFT_595001 [Amniculicola lignicola CBS 123094]|uniref:RING-type domain-containing protein n=1 Tax=Amniculicola lignicola CBS 123094 TaxID=1392246 RepID=A0A6A5WMG5_9PLEO|nr:hypothetical protein P154DRAFT_595001 [Amniculicola lignicola CBS 123094]